MSKKADLVTGVLLMIICGFFMSYFSAQKGESAMMQFGSYFYPKLLITGLGGCSIVLVAQALAGLIRMRGTKTEPVQWRPILKVAIFCFCLALYVFLFFKAGAFIATIVFMPLGQLLFGERKLIIIFVVTLLASATLWGLFAYAFKVVLP